MQQINLNKSYSLLLFILTNVFLVGVKSKDQVFLYSDLNECKDDEYYDHTMFSCTRCDPGKNLRSSINRLRCECNEFSRAIDFTPFHPICLPCDANATVTRDHRDCILCNNSTCQCSPNEIQVERDSNGNVLTIMKCLPCPNNTYLSIDGFQCLPCKHFIEDRKNANEKIYCQRYDESVDWQETKDTYLMKFYNVLVDSYHLRSELKSTFHLCKQGDEISCEHLSNICTMSLLTHKISCDELRSRCSNRPCLFYQKNETLNVLNEKQISPTYNLDKNNYNNIVNFSLSKLNLYGELISTDLDNLPCNFLKNTRFGVNLKKKCLIRVKELLDLEMFFFVPYLKFYEKGDWLLYALPVFIKKTNQKEDLSDAQSVRKFFLVDNVSGFKTLFETTDGNFKKDDNLSVLRYLKSLKVLINVQSGKDSGKIYPPIFIVEYEELKQKQIIENVEISIEYKIEFVLKNINSFDLQIIMGIIFIIAFIFSIIRTWSYYKKNHNQSCRNGSLILWFLIYTTSTVGNGLILLTILIAGYFFVFYKGQTVPHVLLPEDIIEDDLQFCVAISFCFKIVEILGFIYQRTQVNIFFVDWEQPRSMNIQFDYDSPHTTLKKTYGKKPSEIIAAKRKKAIHKISKDKNHHSNPVSIWRSYYIANEWLRLEMNRKTNIIVQMVCTVIAIEMFHLNSWTFAVPELNFNTRFPDANRNFVLKYAVSTFTYVIVYFIQYSFLAVFYEKYIKNRKQEFVNLCSMANISVFILAFNYSGFYIHGRSVHGFADTDLSTLMKYLENEENELCAHRGLLPGTNEQTFRLVLSQGFRNIYNEIVNENTTIDFQHTRSRLREFSCQFLDHCLKNEDYIVKEQHLLEKLCDIPFVNTKEKCIFYIDRNYSYDSIMLFGNEWLITSFEITVYAFVSILYDDYILPLVLTISLSYLVTTCVKCISKNNLVRTSLLDKRFLM